MAEEEYMIEREMEKREGGKNPPPKPDDKAHITVVIFFFSYFRNTLIPTNIPQLGVWAVTYCHGDPG